MGHIKMNLFLLLVLLSCLSMSSLEPIDIDHDDLHVANRFDSSTQEVEFLGTRPKTSAGYLLSHDTDRMLNLSNSIDANLSRLLDKDGPMIRIARGYKLDNISLDVSKRAWELLHYHAAISIKDRIIQIGPIIKQTLLDAKVSPKCYNAAMQTLDRASHLDSWAIKLLNAWGNFPPMGVFEGTYSEVGPYHTCVNIPKNQYIDHAHYCTMKFRPVLPNRKRYEVIVRKEPDELLHMFNRNNSVENNRDIFQDILENANYLQYIPFKMPTCWPIHCSPFDVRRVAKHLARKNILINGPTRCYSKNSEDYEEEGEVGDSNIQDKSGQSTESPSRDKPQKKSRRLLISAWDVNNGLFIWKPHITRAQRLALIVIGVLCSLVIFATLLDLIFNRIGKLFEKFSRAFFNPSKICDNSCKSELNIQRTILNGKTINNKCGELQTTSLHKSNDEQMKLSVASNFPTSDPSPVLRLNIEDGVEDRELNDGELYLPKQDGNTIKFDLEPNQSDKPKRKRSIFWELVKDFSIITNFEDFFTVTELQRQNNITCLDGMRCITMSWIILTHTMLYSDWSSFGRTLEIEKSVTSFFAQPMFNATYLVDTFFLMSGLLLAFTASKRSRGSLARYNPIVHIIGRWLRLTPMIFFVSMLYIVQPLMSDGPHWYPAVGEYSENCSENWWINVLHLQAFFRQDRMCCFVTWWISIDFMYYFLAVAALYIILAAGNKVGALTIGSISGSLVIWQFVRHYTKAVPPSHISTIPQTGLMWTEWTLEFMWRPFSHSIPFFSGLYLGYLIGLKRELIMRKLDTRRALIGWFFSLTWLAMQGFSTYWWVTGKAEYSGISSSIYYCVFPLFWALSINWIIMACHQGYGGLINRFLSCKIFMILGRSSYMVYLTHSQVLAFYIGTRNLLLETNEMTLIYMIASNVILATIHGSLIAILFEYPFLKVQKRIMKCLGH